MSRRGSLSELTDGLIGIIPHVTDEPEKYIDVATGEPQAIEVLGGFEAYDDNNCTRQEGCVKIIAKGKSDAEIVIASTIPFTLMTLEPEVRQRFKDEDSSPFRALAFAARSSKPSRAGEVSSHHTSASVQNTLRKNNFRPGNPVLSNVLRVQVSGNEVASASYELATVHIKEPSKRPMTAALRPSVAQIADVLKQYIPVHDHLPEPTTHHDFENITRVLFNWRMADLFADHLTGNLLFRLALGSEQEAPAIYSTEPEVDHPFRNDPFARMTRATQQVDAAVNASAVAGFALGQIPERDAHLSDLKLLADTMNAPKLEQLGMDQP